MATTLSSTSSTGLFREEYDFYGSISQSTFVDKDAPVSSRDQPESVGPAEGKADPNMGQTSLQDSESDEFSDLLR